MVGDGRGWLLCVFGRCCVCVCVCCVAGACKMVRPGRFVGRPACLQPPPHRLLRNPPQPPHRELPSYRIPRFPRTSRHEERESCNPQSPIIIAACAAAAYSRRDLHGHARSLGRAPTAPQPAAVQLFPVRSGHLGNYRHWTGRNRPVVHCNIPPYRLHHLRVLHTRRQRPGQGRELHAAFVRVYTHTRGVARVCVRGLHAYARKHRQTCYCSSVAPRGPFHLRQVPPPQGGRSQQRTAVSMAGPRWLPVAPQQCRAAPTGPLPATCQS